MSKLKIWLLAARPKTLWAGVGPVLIGTALAYSDGLMHWPSAVVALFASITIQIATNFANDYFDFVHGADTVDRTGPTRVTQAKLISANEMKWAFIIMFTISFMSGLFLVYRGGWPILIIGVLSIIFGILYTGGPFPLGYLGLGDILVTIFFGPVAVGGTYYAQALQFNWIVFLAGLSPGLISTSILVANNLRDIATDLKAGKRTLAVRFGETFSRIQYTIMIISAALIPVGLFIFTRKHPYSLAAVLILAFSIPTIKIIFKERDGATLNQALADTGKILLIYSIIFSAGWIL
ncbi:MAG: 1,4-dihydroxy-2-naphthoate polyprenyltransferase [Caldithrix sp.]|nr:1,4-dihydroxy-2-naphthoate polyprenyltransferase [Caldithrix sp.]